MDRTPKGWKLAGAILRMMWREARRGPFAPKLFLSAGVFLVGVGTGYLVEFLLSFHPTPLAVWTARTFIVLRTLLGILEIWCIPMGGEDEREEEEEEVEPSPPPSNIRQPPSLRKRRRRRASLVGV